MTTDQTVIGRAEWVTLEGLSLPPMLARIDSGAKTSSLHAYDIEEFEKGDGEMWVRFKTHPKPLDAHGSISCEAEVIDQRTIKSSNGHKETRYVVESLARMGDEVRAVKFTLSNRKSMRFRILIGRQALSRFDYLIDVAKRATLGVPEEELTSISSEDAVSSHS